MPTPGHAPEAFDWSKPIPNGPLAQGFDYYFGDDVPNFPPYTWIENDRVLKAPTVPLENKPKTAEGAWECRPGPMVPDWDFYAVMPTLTEKALAWIGEQKGKQEPFLLYFPFTSPHAPIVPTPEFTGKSQAGGYGDYMTQTDATVGRVLQALEKHGFRDNTIVIFSSDNGPENYAQARRKNFQHDSARPLRGLKRDVYEGGHRVPFIVRWPGTIKPGQVCESLVSQVDLMATLAAAVGFTLPSNSAHDSHDLLPLWKSGESNDAPRNSLVHNTFAKRWAIRAGDWVLVNAEEGKAGSKQKPPELFNLRADLSQAHDLREQNSEKVAELTTLLSTIRNNERTRPE